MTQHPHIEVSYGEGVRTLTLRRPFAPFALAATLLAAFLFLFAWPQSAAAHDSLVDSDPAADSTVETLPEELTLTFSAALIGGEGTTAVEILDADGNSVIDGEPTVDGAMVTQQLTTEAAAGEYIVEWRVVSSDGHPTDGEFSFTVTTSTLPVETMPPTSEPSAEPTASATAPAPEASAAPAPETSAPSATKGTPADGDAFLRVLPWILGGIVVAAGGGALVYILVARARRQGPSTGSDNPTER